MRTPTNVTRAQCPPCLVRGGARHSRRLSVTNAQHGSTSPAAGAVGRFRSCTVPHCFCRCGDDSAFKARAGSLHARSASVGTAGHPGPLRAQAGLRDRQGIRAARCSIPTRPAASRVQPTCA